MISDDYAEFGTKYGLTEEENEAMTGIRGHQVVLRTNNLSKKNLGPDCHVFLTAAKPVSS